MMRKLLTVADLAEKLNIPVNSVYRLSRAGKIPSLKVGNSLRFDPMVIASWMDDRYEFGMKRPTN